MGIRERKEKEKEILRREILAAASELFAREGTANLSMRKIAQKIEYSPTTIYLYFKDKNDLLYQICEETFRQLADEVGKIKEMALGPIEALRGGMRAYIEFGLANPFHYEAIFINPFDFDEDCIDEFDFDQSMGKVAFDKLREAVESCIESGAIKRADGDLVSQMLWASIHGLTSILISHEKFPFAEKDDLIDMLLDTLIKGLKA